MKVYVRNFEDSSLARTYIVMMITDGAGDMAGPVCNGLSTGAESSASHLTTFILLGAFKLWKEGLVPLLSP